MTIVPKDTPILSPDLRLCSSRGKRDREDGVSEIWGREATLACRGTLCNH